MWTEGRWARACSATVTFSEGQVPLALWKLLRASSAIRLNISDFCLAYAAYPFFADVAARDIHVCDMVSHPRTSLRNSSSDISTSSIQRSKSARARNHCTRSARISFSKEGWQKRVTVTHSLRWMHPAPLRTYSPLAQPAISSLQ